MDAYSLGQILREARESKELEIEDVVARLRIRQPILEGFEAGEFDISGVPEIQVRGLLRIYARHLELDEEHVLLLYGQMRLAQEKGRRGRRIRRRRQTEPIEATFSSTQPLQEFEQVDRRRSGCRGTLRLLLLLLFSAAAIGVIVFVTVELVGIESFLQPSETPEAAELAATDTVAVSPTVAPLVSEATVPAGRAQYTGSGILVSVLVTQRSWISLQSDGNSVYEGIAEADTLLEYTAETEVTLSAANALALDVIWNGQRQGVVGERGQRVDIRFTIDQAIITLGPGGAPSAVPTEVAVEVVAVATEPEAAPTQSEPLEASPTPAVTVISTPLPTPIPTAAATVTPLPTDTPPPTALAAAPVPADPTALLPPRVTQAGLPPTKEGA